MNYSVLSREEFEPYLCSWHALMLYGAYVMLTAIFHPGTLETQAISLLVM